MKRMAYRGPMIEAQTQMRRPTEINHVFVVGTGRCGTTSLVSLLNRMGDCRVGHELEPVLLEEMSAFFDGRLLEAAMVKLLKRTRSDSTCLPNRIYGESNQRLSFVLPQLAKAFPNARIIWLVRDGRDTVASMYHRYWYHRQENLLRSAGAKRWIDNRVLGTQTGDLEEREWRRMSSFDKSCWYWGYTNRLIRKYARLSTSKVLRVRVEDLPGFTREIAAFLGIDALKLDDVPHVNRAIGGTPGEWRLWSKRQSTAFERFAGAEMDLLYPDWREDWNARRASPVERLIEQIRRKRRVAADYQDGLRRRIALRTRLRRLLRSNESSRLPSDS